MATATFLTRDDWNARALELAEARDLMGAARVLAADSYCIAYGVHRSRCIGSEYIVLVTRRDGYAACDCLAGHYGKPCGHVGAALYAERQRQREAERVAFADADRWELIEAGQW